MSILLVCRMPNSYLRCHTATVSLVDLRHRKRASQSVSPLNESKKEDEESKSEDEDSKSEDEDSKSEDEDSKSEGEDSKSEDKDKGSDSEEEELTPWPKRTILKMRIVDDGISELPSTDSDWKISIGDNDRDEDEDEPDGTDLGTMKNTLLTFIIQIWKRAHCRRRRKQSHPRKRRLEKGTRRVA